MCHGRIVGLRRRGDPRIGVCGPKSQLLGNLELGSGGVRGGNEEEEEEDEKIDVLVSREKLRLEILSLCEPRERSFSVPRSNLRKEVSIKTR